MITYFMPAIGLAVWLLLMSWIWRRDWGKNETVEISAVEQAALRNPKVAEAIAVAKSGDRSGVVTRGVSNGHV